jgi:hypothetical protein
VPDIGDIAGEQGPGFAPVGAVVVRNFAGACGHRDARLVAPGRVVVDAVGWIADQEVWLGAIEKPGRAGGIGRVAAQETVAPQNPEIAGPRDRLSGRFGNLVFVRLLAIAVTIETIE